MNEFYGAAVVGQSGGPTAAINATLAGVIRGALDAKEKGELTCLYGMRNGVEGLLREDLINLTDRFAGGRDLNLLTVTPAAALGSCRKKLKPISEDSETFDKLFAVFEKYGIHTFFYIGGNDSMDTVLKLTEAAKKYSYPLRVVGVPKTIDNDLAGTDHTPGFGSAAKYIATTMREIVRDTAVYTVKAVTVVEIMGRDAGWLTASAALAGLPGGEGPDLIYLPERVFDPARFIASVRAKLETKPNVVVAVSEGVRLADGSYVGEGGQSGAKDIFGHKYLAGTGKVLEQTVKNEIGCKVRSVELSLPQRCAAHLASGTDLSEGFSVGSAAVAAAVSGKTGVMMTMQRKGDGEAYALDFIPAPISGIANAVRTVPDEFINETADGVTEACIRYLRPLILGEAKLVFEDGLPKQLIL